MKLISQSFADQGNIPEKNAYGKPDGQGRVALAGNANPHLAWTDAPEGTQSFVIVMHDPDVPSKPDDVNQLDREVPESLARIDFYHWLLVDIPKNLTQVIEGAFSNGVTPRGKAGPLALDGMRQGLNDYTKWFGGDHDLSGDYFGYDGPCPPWNDALLHRYVFTLYALDIPELPLEGKFTGPEVLAAIKGHVLAQASVTGLYTLNQRLR